MLYIALILIVLLTVVNFKKEVLKEIRYIDRKNNTLMVEKVPGEKWLKWLYYSPMGCIATSTLIKNKALSSIYGRAMDSPKSKEKIPKFIEEFNINMSESLESDFENFNDFFIRKLKDDARPIDKSEDTISSPADGKVLYFKDLSKVEDFFIKGSRFDLKTFLGNDSWYNTFKDGSMLIVRLAPADYHRFHFPVDGEVIDRQDIEGDYYSVSPYAVKHNIDIYFKNKRSNTYIKTCNGGDVIMVEVGATMVGTIIQTYQDTKFKKGQEKGYFKFGGSTVVLLFEKDKFFIDEDIEKNSKNGIETSVYMGEKIGKTN